MLKAMGSRIALNLDDSDVATEYRDCVKDLISTDEVISLMDQDHHLSISRFDHCLNVSYLSFLICRRMGYDARAAARGGLLHDLFFYNWRDRGISIKEHFVCHPRNALENARRLCALTGTEEDVILNHMWPSTRRLPKTKEAFVVCMVDKYCGMGEGAQSLSQSVAKRGRAIKRVAKRAFAPLVMMLAGRTF